MWVSFFVITVVEASNGIQAWKILEDIENRIDIILTEVAMPCFSGIALLCKIMSHKTRKNVPVISKSLHMSFSSASLWRFRFLNNKYEVYEKNSYLVSFQFQLYYVFFLLSLTYILLFCAYFYSQYAFTFELLSYHLIVLTLFSFDMAITNWKMGGSTCVLKWISCRLLNVIWETADPPPILLSLHSHVLVNDTLEPFKSK